MRTIKRSSAFKKDFKRILANPRHGRDVPQLLEAVLPLLAVDAPLPMHFRDHALVCNWKHHRECHLKPDLLLIYKQPVDDEILELVRLGSHTELFD